MLRRRLYRVAKPAYGQRHARQSVSAKRTEIFEKIAVPQERTRTITDFAIDKIKQFDDKSRRIAGRLLEYGCYPWQTRTTYIARDKGGSVSLFRQAGIHTGKAKCLQGIEKGKDQLFGVAPAIKMSNQY